MRIKHIFTAIMAATTIAISAQAKVLVITERFEYTGATNLDRRAWEWQQSRSISAFLDLMNRTNANYTVVSADRMITENARMGVLVTGTNVERFDGVILLNPRGKSEITLRPMAPAFNGFAPCSLTYTGRLPRVPIVWAFGGTIGVRTTQFGETGAMACTSGAVTVASAAPLLIVDANTNRRWFSGSNINGVVGGSTIRASVQGGVRPLLTGKVHSYHSQMATLPANRNPECNNCDSIWGTTNLDTSAVWERLLIGQTLPDGANPNTRLVFANIMGSYGCVDSLSLTLGNAPQNPCEFDEVISMYTLAHLDSLTGGKVWDKPTGIKQLTAAVTIDGAFCRGNRNNPGGIPPSDSSVFQACMDSIATLGIPITVGANVDSLSAYPSEVSWWLRAGAVRFSPQAWAGLKQAADGSMDTSGTYTSLGSSTTFPVDIFGRFRLRQAMGDGTDTSSVYSGLVNSRSILRTYVGNRLSGLAMAPLDDYSPKNMGWSTGPPPDSIIYAIWKAGFRCLRTDVQSRSASYQRNFGNKDLTKGYIAAQGTYYNSLIGGTFPVLGHAGHSISGSKYSWIPYSDGTDSISSQFPTQGGDKMSNPPIPNSVLGRFWHGLAHEEFYDPDWNQRNSGQGYDAGGNTFANVIYPQEDHFSPQRHASLLKMHMSDFAGIPNGPPKRPGWWSIKSIYNSFQVINAAAQRNVCALVWPEDITP